MAFDLENLDHEWQKAEALELDCILGCSEARAEFTESAESTLREDLERERADRLEGELPAARRGFWRRLFG